MLVGDIQGQTSYEVITAVQERDDGKLDRPVAGEMKRNGQKEKCRK